MKTDAAKRPQKKRLKEFTSNALGGGADQVGLVPEGFLDGEQVKEEP